MAARAQKCAILASLCVQGVRCEVCYMQGARGVMCEVYPLYPSCSPMVAHHELGRGGSKRAVAYLSMHAGRAFPAAKKRVQAFRKQRGGVVRAHALVYAVEQEIAARRAAREDKWPKTSGMELRNPQKKAALVALKQQYDRAYQHLRHLRRSGQQLQAAARLTTQRLLREAWMILLDVPARRHKCEAIPLGNSPKVP